MVVEQRRGVVGSANEKRVPRSVDVHVDDDNEVPVVIEVVQVTLGRMKAGMVTAVAVCFICCPNGAAKTDSQKRKKKGRLFAATE